jgi:hypothetical protein
LGRRRAAFAVVSLDPKIELFFWCHGQGSLPGCPAYVIVPYCHDGGTRKSQLKGVFRWPIVAT